MGVHSKSIQILNPPALFIICGSQGSGKSHLIKYIFRENYLSSSRFDYGIVFSNTSWENGSFDYIPKSYIYEEFSETALLNLMNLQKANLSKGINTSAFVLFDDCLDDVNQFTNRTIKKLTTQLRHYNITMILSTQYVHLIPPRIRANAMKVAFFWCGPGRRETESLYDSYGSRFESFTEFKHFYYDNIDDHKFIMYNREEDKYITYRAPEKIPPFVFKYNKIK